MPTLENLRNSILTSIYGRRLGLDANECLVGPKALTQAVVTSLTSDSSGSTINAYGITAINATTLSTMVLNLPNPIPGVGLTVIQGYGQNASTVVSSATYLKCQSSQTINSSLGSTYAIVLVSSRAAVELVGLTTAQWQLKSITNSTNIYSQATT
jgi:hypothetical protein